MVKKIIYILSLMLFTLACSNIEVEKEPLPQVKNLTPQAIDTELPVVELFAPEDEFEFMFNNWNEKIIVDGYLTLNRGNKVVLDSVALEMEIRGSSSAAYVMKTIGVVFNEEINNNAKELINPRYKLPHDDISRIKALRFRNSGNDFGESMIKDLSYSRLAARAGIDVELMYGEPVQVFVNGNYYGLLNMRTESTRAGVSRLWNAETQELIRMEVDVDNGNLEYRDGNATYAYQIRNAIDDQDAMKLYQMVDVNNFIDYILFQDYIGNRDWPHNNVKAHSLKGAPWRFFLFDLDYAAYNTKNPKIPEMEYKDDDISLMFQALIKIPGFREELQNRRKEIYRDLTPEIYNQIVDELAKEIENEIPYLISKYQRPPNHLFWKMQIDELKHEFERRNHFIRKKYDL